NAAPTQPGGRGIRVPVPNHPTPSPRPGSPTLELPLLGLPLLGLPLSLVLMSPVIPERPTVGHSAQIAWLIRAMRLIRWTIDPQINHEARINHDKSRGSSHRRANNVTGGTEVAAGRAHRRHRVGQERSSPAAGGTRRGAH